MNIGTIILAGVVALAVAIGGFILAVWMLVWNITDMQNVGVNFWNVFWSLLALTFVLGGSAKWASN